MALGKDRNRIHIKGGGSLQLKELPSGSYEDVGYLNDSEINDNTDTSDSHDETGAYVKMLLGNEKVVFISSLKQTSKEEIDLLRNSKGKFYEARYMVELYSGRTQLWSLGDCQVDPNYALKYDKNERNLPLRLILLKGGTTGLYYETVEVDKTPSQVIEGDWPDAS